MGVDHDTIFAYGFLLKSFREVNKQEYKWEELESYLLDFSNLDFATDAYYDGDIFIYISGSGFTSGNRGNWSTFETTPSSQVSFHVTQEEVEQLTLVREHFKEYLRNEEIGWTSFSYSH